MSSSSVVFVGPLPGREQGGADAAIDCLARALRDADVDVAVCEFPFKLPQRPTVFHFHSAWQTHHIPLYKHCISNRIPYVISPHGMLAGWRLRQKWWKKLPYLILVERRNLKRSSRILVTSDLERREVLRVVPKANTVIIPLGLTGSAVPNYAESRKKLGWSHDEKILLFLSRLSPEKGIELLLEALQGVTRQVAAKLRLIIVGGGEEKYVIKLKEYCNQHEKDLPPVEWIGSMWGDDRWKYFQGADVFCLPSHSENFGLVILEACQVGTPVVTTTFTPWEHLNDLGYGAVVERNVSRLRNGLIKCLSLGWTEKKRQDLARWAWSTHSWSNIVEKYKALYGDVGGWD